VSTLVPSRSGSASYVYDVVAVGASAGGLHSLGALIEAFPGSFRCPVLVVQHLSPEYKSIFAEILGRGAGLPVQQAVDREKMHPGVVYVGPPAVHLVVEKGAIRLRSTPLVKFQRPSINMLFESVAAEYGNHAIAVVLSGSGSDGADGTRNIKSAGGYTIAEDPATAGFNAMPKAAIATGCVDKVLESHEIGKLIFELCQLRQSLDPIAHG
jgi:chemotaxis response regulator CheB